MTEGSFPQLNSADRGCAFLFSCPEERQAGSGPTSATSFALQSHSKTGENALLEGLGKLKFLLSEGLIYSPLMASFTVIQLVGESYSPGR